MGRSIEKEVWYPQPPARVWMALTDRDALTFTASENEPGVAGENGPPVIEAA